MVPTVYIGCFPPPVVGCQALLAEDGGHLIVGWCAYVKGRWSVCITSSHVCILPLGVAELGGGGDAIELVQSHPSLALRML